MATQTRAVLKQLLSEAMGDYNSLTTTTIGAAAGASLISTGLLELSNDDDFCKDWWIEITALVSGGPPVGEIRKILSFTVSTWTIVPVTAFSLQVKTGTAFLLHRINPTQKHEALKQASVLCFPQGGKHGLYLPLSDETLAVDNLLLNASLDTFSTTFTSWSNIGTPTLAAETTRKVHGSGSASITASGAVEGIEQNIFTKINIKEVVGKTLCVRGWVWCATADSARIRVTLDGSTYTNSDYNGGDAEWEGPDVQEIDVVITADATEITVSCEVADGITAYFDLVTAYIDPINKYTLPTTMIRGPFQVEQQYDELNPTSNFYPIGAQSSLVPGRVLRLTGMGYLSQPTADTGTVELDVGQADYFVAQAIQWLYRALLQGGSQQEREYIRQLRQEWQQDIALMEQRGPTMDNMVMSPSPAWRVGPPDSSGRYLEFTRYRG